MNQLFTFLRNINWLTVGYRLPVYAVGAEHGVHITAILEDRTYTRLWAFLGIFVFNLILDYIERKKTEFPKIFFIIAIMLDLIIHFLIGSMIAVDYYYIESVGFNFKEQQLNTHLAFIFEILMLVLWRFILFFVIHLYEKYTQRNKKVDSSIEGNPI